MTALALQTSTEVEGLQTGAFIGGRWLSLARTFEVRDPADGSLIAQVTDGDAMLARAAVEAAVEAFPAWRGTLARTRADLLRAWGGLIRDQADALARLISREQGKPLGESRAEIAYGAAYIDWFAGEAVRDYGDVIPTPFEGRRLTATPGPVGVVAVITPWNLPFAMIARKLAPALAAGCTVVAKPAEDTPLSALALAALAKEAGFPAGVLNLVPASRAAAGPVVDAWLDDARVRKISFTGSTTVGQMLAARSGATLKRLSLELGGDAPFIVLPDADIDAAVAGLMKAKFRNAGQTCIAPNRVMVHTEVHDAFCDRLAQAVDALTVGPSAKAHFDVGPLIHAAAARRVETLVRHAVEDGARIMAGGAPHPCGGGFVTPTLLTEVTETMRLEGQEIFGPVLAVRRFEKDAGAVEAANRSFYGLAAYVFGADARRLAIVIDGLETGMVGVNEGLISTEVAPFGGVKFSGYGREGSRHGLSDYQSLKYVCAGTQP